MVKIFMILAKMATLGLLKIKVMAPKFMSMTSQTNFYHVIQIVL